LITGSDGGAFYTSTTIEPSCGSAEPWDAHRLFQPGPPSALLVATPSEIVRFPWSLQATAVSMRWCGSCVVRKARTAPICSTNSQPRAIPVLLRRKLGRPGRVPGRISNGWSAMRTSCSSPTVRNCSIVNRRQFALLLDLLEKTARKWNQTEKGGRGPSTRRSHRLSMLPEDEAALPARFQRHGRSLNRLK